MATTEDIVDDLPFGAERLPLPVGQPASKAAIAVLEDAKPDQRVTVRRVLQVCRGDAPAHTASAQDWVRALDHADGDLVATTWSSTGVTHVGLDPDGGRQPYDVGGFTALPDDGMEFLDAASAAAAKDILTGEPQAIARDESDLLPGGGD